MITSENLIRHELIGLKVKVLTSTNPKNQGMSGRVVDEHRNIFILDVRGVEKTLAKKENTFLFTLPSGKRVSVEGHVLIARPEDRIKKKIIKHL